MKADLDTRTTERDTAKVAATQATEAQAALKADLDTRTKERDEAKALVVKHEATLSALRLEQRKAAGLHTEKVLRLEHGFEQFQLDLRRAAQAQERAQAENDVLKVSYAAVQEEKRKLLHLVQQLTPKLREAAQYMREIPAVKQSDVVGILEGVKPSKTKKKKKNTDD